MFSAPFLAGISPVSKAPRLGAHAGEATKAFLNTIPSDASLSRYGVFKTLASLKPISFHPRSSAKYNIIFGFEEMETGLALLQRIIKIPRNIKIEDLNKSRGILIIFF